MASSRWSSPAAASAVADDLLDLGILEDDAVAVDSLDRAELELWPEPDMNHPSDEACPDDLEIELGKLVEEAMEAMSDASVSDDGSEAPPAEIATPMMPAPSSSPVSAAVTPLPRKKPAARKPRPNERCAGLTGSPCRFHSTGNGDPARIHPDRGEIHCLFCDSVKCRATTERVLLNLLKTFKDKGDGLYNAALCRLRQHLGEAKVASLIDPWQVRLQQRRSASAPLKPKPRDAYEVEVKRDRRVARRKVFFPDKLHSRAAEADEAAEVEHVRNIGIVEDLADNDTGLPKPRDAIPRFVEDWCKQGSWGICEKCHSMCPRPLQPVDTRRIAKPTIPANQCTACQKGEYVPQSADIPEPLRDLKPRVIEALRPLEIDTGAAERVQFGYRVHTAMISFAWEPVSVEYKITSLEKRKDRQAAEAAYLHLMSSSTSAYKDFVVKHNEFLEKHGDNAEKKVRKRPLRFLEEEGLECALWPHLYYHKNLCETVARATHETRQKTKQGRKRRVEDSSDEEAAEDAPDGEVGQREDAIIAASKMGRIKRGFIRKVLSPVIGYGADYQLLHFVYDLSMWTTIGTKRNIATRCGVPLRLLLKGSPWTPQYWRVRHQALIDMQRQCGNASLFRTRAPYERTFPYHRWILHEQEVLGRPRQHLAGAETLHMAHVLLQLDKGYLFGDRAHAGRTDRTWKEHLLGPLSADRGNTVVAHATRLEFQDGKRKRGTQKYHGRGTTHSHSLDFLENMESIGLESKVQATIPPKNTEPLLHGLVTDSQCDYKDSGLPVREEPSAWDPDGQKVLLHHTEDDKDAKVRAYFKDTMEVTKCHEDVQQGDGNGAVLRYVSTYNMKFSNSMDSDWLNGAASDYSTAAGVLRRYQPLEPEMWLTLAQERFPQAYLSGTFVDYMAPSLDTQEDMTLLEFLRKSNAQGEIIHHIRKKHQEAVMEEVRAFRQESDKDFAACRKELLSAFRRHRSERKARRQETKPLTEFLADHDYEGLTTLEDFANNYVCRGEKLAAVSTHSMLNDRYYGQWLALNRPFRRLEEFIESAPEVVERVPEKYRHFALCVHHAADFWESEGLIRGALELEARSNAFIETILRKIQAQKHLVKRYLNQEIPVTEVLSAEESEEGAGDDTAPRSKLTNSQKLLARAMKEQMQNTMAAAEAQDDEAQEVCIAAAAEHKILFANGPPGTGKTHVVHEQIRRWKQQGARILFALPTGQLASEMRAVHPEIDVDTSHGAFLLHRPLQEAMAILTQYDLVVVDEVSMLTAGHFEHILALWKYADQLPCLVLLGDFWQLPVVDKTAERCEQSAAWAGHVKTIPFREQVRCKCPALQAKLDILRTAVPSMQQLKKILRGHRAWTTREPTGYDLLELFRQHENTTVVTCTRHGAATINDLAATVFFEDRHKHPLGVLPLDYEANQDNYGRGGRLRSGTLQPALRTVYKGMRIFLTKNMSKEDDFVNGMAATVEDFDERSQCLQVLTRTNQRLAVYMVTHELDDGRKVAAFPVRLGYASTVPKVQGMTLPHVTIWLDHPGCRAAAYVAMSRVQTDADYLIAGLVSTKHFVPAH
ncbi:unnamed protein product [Symbiodinium sp. KB8]|nr:unnamed protein product [Symbiodinium sp. KB8]